MKKKKTKTNKTISTAASAREVAPTKPLVFQKNNESGSSNDKQNKEKDKNNFAAKIHFVTQETLIF